MEACRLLVVNHAVETGGAERVLLDFLRRLDRERFEPGLAVPYRGPLVEEAEALGVRIHLGFPSRRLLEIRRKSLGGRRAAAAYPLDFLATVLRLALLIRRESYRLVFTNSAKADIYGSLAGWLARRPVAWRFHDLASPETFSRLNLWLLRTFATLFARRVLAISGAVREALLALGVPEEKVKVVYNGVEAREDAGEMRQRVRREWGLPDDCPAVGLVGRLVEWKGPDVFLRAAARVAEYFPETRFFLVGGAIFGREDYPEELRELSRSLGLEERAVFTGFLRDPLPAMAALDCLVHASVEPEPLGMVILEAMSLGLPVVATEGGGVPEIVEDGRTGLLVPPGDAEAMARAVVWMLSHPEERKEMGERGRKRVKEAFELGARCREMEDELLALLRPGTWGG
ncbi:glycosyltransferase [Candidatus Solincola sp.]|nr:glycosyltransferase [Actinomycetota bacterium]MDI7252603.1 glycosyltransferase [Actinomycetota bacterium]